MMSVARPGRSRTDVQTLFRVAVAILKINEVDIIACETAGDLFTFVSSMTSRLWAADKLIQVRS